jgi:hypothetical protein
MRRIRRPDPFVSQVFLRNPPDKEILGQGRALLAHLDGASPADLEPGTHRADFLVSDEYGRERRDHLAIEVGGCGRR